MGPALYKIASELLKEAGGELLAKVTESKVGRIVRKLREIPKIISVGFVLSGNFPEIIDYSEAISLIGNVLKEFKKNGKLVYQEKVFDYEYLPMIVEDLLPALTEESLDSLLLLMPQEECKRIELERTEKEMEIEYPVEGFKLYFAPPEIPAFQLKEVFKIAFDLTKNLQKKFSAKGITTSAYVILKIEPSHGQELSYRISKELEKLEYPAPSITSYKLSDGDRILINFDDYRIVMALEKVF